MNNAFHSCFWRTVCWVQPTGHSCRSRQIFLGGCERFLPEFPQNCPKKFWTTFYAIFVWFWAPFFQIKARCAPFLSNQSKLGAISARIFMEFAQIFQRFSQILPRFPLILPRFSGILPGFSTDQNIWEWACTPCTPASYTTATGDVNFISRPSQKFLFDNSAVLHILYKLPLSAASAAALNDHRIFLFLYSFKTKCLNIAVMWVRDFSVLPFRSGRFVLSRSGLETFRSGYEILQKSYTCSLFNANVLKSTKGFI